MPTEMFNLVTKQYENLDTRIRELESATKVIQATMITWRRALVALGSSTILLGTLITLGDRLWGV